MITAREWLNVLAILESIDEVPGMPASVAEGAFSKDPDYARLRVGIANADFRANPVRFLRRADDATRAAIWAEVERRVGSATVGE